MKNAQVNLLMAMALALCGLCAWQWYEQTLQRNGIEALNRLVYDRDAAIQGYTNSLAMLTHQAAQLDARLGELKSASATNEQVAAARQTELEALHSANLNLTNAITQYQQTVEALETRLKEAYAGIERQNEAISNLLAERNELTRKYNDQVKDRNDIVAKYNELVKQVENLQNAPKSP